MNKKILRVLFLPFFLIVLSLTQPSLAGGEEAASSLFKLIKSMRSISASFDQNIIDTSGVLIQQSVGEFSLQRPNKIYWKTRPPYEQEIVGNGQTLWVFDADLDQATQYPEGSLLQGPMALFSESLESIQSRFNVSLVSENNAGVMLDRFTLEPKTNHVEQGFQSLVFEYRGEQLAAIEIHDKLRQKTVITLNSVDLNQVISDDRFEFTPPEGVDVIINE